LYCPPRPRPPRPRSPLSARSPRPLGPPREPPRPPRAGRSKRPSISINVLSSFLGRDFGAALSCINVEPGQASM
jgi:hypothetical protein